MGVWNSKDVGVWVAIIRLVELNENEWRQIAFIPIFYALKSPLYPLK
jgi:hypothetical protein